MSSEYQPGGPIKLFAIGASINWPAFRKSKEYMNLPPASRLPAVEAAELKPEENVLLYPPFLPLHWILFAHSGNFIQHPSIKSVVQGMQHAGDLGIIESTAATTASYAIYPSIKQSTKDLVRDNVNGLPVSSLGQGVMHKITQGRDIDFVSSNLNMPEVQRSVASSLQQHLTGGQYRRSTAKQNNIFIEEWVFPRTIKDDEGKERITLSNGFYSTGQPFLNIDVVTFAKGLQQKTHMQVKPKTWAGVPTSYEALSWDHAALHVLKYRPPLQPLSQDEIIQFKIIELAQSGSLFSFVPNPFDEQVMNVVLPYPGFGDDIWLGFDYKDVDYLGSPIRFIDPEIPLPELEMIATTARVIRKATENEGNLDMTTQGLVSFSDSLWTAQQFIDDRNLTSEDVRHSGFMAGSHLSDAPAIDRQSLTFLKENSYRLAVRNNDRNPLLNLLLQDVADESASHAIDIFEGFTTNLMVAVIRNYARAWRYIRATDTEKLLPAFQGLTEKQLEQIDGKISELSDRERVLFSHRFGEQRAINELRQYIMKERVLDEIYFRKFNSIKIDALQEKDKEQLMKEEFGIHKMFTILSSYIPVIAGEDEFSYMCRAFSLLKPFDTVNLYLIAKG